MTKTEIIEAIAYANVPSGATLVERDVPGTGVRISKVGSLEIVIARLFAGQLETLSNHLPEEPSPALFNWLHRSALAIHQDEIERLTIPGLKLGMVAKHQKLVEKLREITEQLGITYEEPNDPLLKQGF